MQIDPSRNSVWFLDKAGNPSYWEGTVTNARRSYEDGERWTAEFQATEPDYIAMLVSFVGGTHIVIIDRTGYNPTIFIPDNTIILMKDCNPVEAEIDTVTNEWGEFVYKLTISFILKFNGTDQKTFLSTEGINQDIPLRKED